MIRKSYQVIYRNYPMSPALDPKHHFDLIDPGGNLGVTNIDIRIGGRED